MHVPCGLIFAPLAVKRFHLITLIYTDTPISCPSYSLFQLRGKQTAGGDDFKFRCRLNKFQVAISKFTQDLAKFTKSPLLFCEELSKMTDGIVAFQEDTNNKGTLEDDTPQETRKRRGQPVMKTSAQKRRGFPKSR